MEGKTIFTGTTEEAAKFAAVSAGFVVIGTAPNRKKGFWVAFARRQPDKIF